MKVNKQISLKLETDIYDYLKKISEDNRTTISAEIRRILFKSFSNSKTSCIN